MQYAFQSIIKLGRIKRYTLIVEGIGTLANDMIQPYKTRKNLWFFISNETFSEVGPRKVRGKLMPICRSVSKQKNFESTAQNLVLQVGKVIVWAKTGIQHIY